jgi:hypothetical protein
MGCYISFLLSLHASRAKAGRNEQNRVKPALVSLPLLCSASAQRTERRALRLREHPRSKHWGRPTNEGACIPPAAIFFLVVGGARKGSGLWLCLAELLLVKKIAYLDTVENQLVLIFYF